MCELNAERLVWRSPLAAGFLAATVLVDELEVFGRGRNRDHYGARGQRQCLWTCILFSTPMRQDESRPPVPAIERQQAGRCRGSAAEAPAVTILTSPSMRVLLDSGCGGGWQDRRPGTGWASEVLVLGTVIVERPSASVSTSRHLETPRPSRHRAGPSACVELVVELIKVPTVNSVEPSRSGLRYGLWRLKENNMKMNRPTAPELGVLGPDQVTSGSPSRMRNSPSNRSAAEQVRTARVSTSARVRAARSATRFTTWRAKGVTTKLVNCTPAWELARAGDYRRRRLMNERFRRSVHYQNV